jgi:multidrug efflux pump subunit AcrA (membrane-fusion protein)
MHVRHAAVIAALVLGTAACGSSASKGSSASNATSGGGAYGASATTAAPATTTAPTGATAAVFKVAEVGDDKLIVNSEGKTLYAFSPDSATTSACNASCDTVWPPLTATSTPPATIAGLPVTVLTRPAQVDPASATADVRLGFTKRTSLAAGTMVQVRLITGSHPKALVIPTAAVVKDDDDTFVMVVTSDNKAHKQAVTIGLQTRELAEVKTGLKAGDLVITHGQDGLPDGAAITIEK